MPEKAAKSKDLLGALRAYKVEFEKALAEAQETCKFARDRLRMRPKDGEDWSRR